MISSKKQYNEYLDADLKAYFKRDRYKVSLLQRLFSKNIKFIYLLRKAEYYSNCKRSKLGKVMAFAMRTRLRLHEEKCGYSIPINVLGKGCVVVHLGTVIINPYAKLGDYCRIHAGVNIGTAAGKHNAAPKIGNRVYIGPGAKIFGDIEIADDIAIGANSVVNKSFEQCGISIAGVPAKKISDNGSSIFL